MKRILLISALMMLLITSCVTRKRCNELYPCQGSVVSTKDSTTSTETNIIPHDSIIYLTDSASFKLYLKCDSLGNVRLCEIETLKASQNIKPSFTLSNNNLYAACIVDSAAVAISWNEKHVSKTTTVNANSRETIPVIINDPTAWQWFWIRTGQIVTCLILGTLIIFIIVKFKKIKP